MKSKKVIDPALAEMSNVLTQRNRNLPWVKRVLDKSPLFLTAPNGDKITHRLGYTGVDNGYMVYPTIVEKNGKLSEFSNDGDAIDYAFKTNTGLFIDNEELAKYYSENGLIQHFEEGGTVDTVPRQVPNTQGQVDTSNPHTDLEQIPEGQLQGPEDKLIAIAKDFYTASGKKLSDEKAKLIVSTYGGDYEKMLNDLYSASGKTLSPERLKLAEKHYNLLEEKLDTPEVSKEILDFNSKIDELEDNFNKVSDTSASIGADSPRMAPPPGFEQRKKEAKNRINNEKSDLIDSFEFKPLSYREVVNSMGKGRDDVDEVSQTSKLYLEKYTQRMKESLDRYKSRMSLPAQEAINKVENGQDFDPSTLNEQDLSMLQEWEKKRAVLDKQESLNNSTIHKTDELRAGLNSVARQAKDEDRSVKDAIIKYMDENGVDTEGLKELRDEGEFSDYDLIATVSAYNTKERVVNSFSSLWRGVKEAFDFSEKSTVYDKQYAKDFDNFLKKEIDQDIKRLMWGTNKTKYDGDIRELQVNVDGVRVMVDEDGNAIGVRKEDGNQSYSYTDKELSAIKKYNENRDELKKGASHEFRGGSLLGKGAQVMTDMAPIMAATIATGGATGTFLGTFAVSYGDYYDQQFAKTGSVGNATAYASAATVMTAMLEGIGGVEGSIIRTANKKKLAEVVKEAAAEAASKNVVNGTTAMQALAKHLVANGFEETGIELLQSLGEAELNIMFNNDADLSWKELEEIVILTPFATGPISLAASGIQGTFKNYEMEQLKTAARKKDVFNKIVDEWVGAAKTEEEKSKRQKEADYKKSLVDELSNNLLAADELKIVDPKVHKAVIEKSEEIVNKRKEIDEAKSEKTKSVLGLELAQLQSDITELLDNGKKSKETVQQVIDRSEQEAADREERTRERESQAEVDAVSQDPDVQRLNIVPDNNKDAAFKDKIPTSEDFEAIYDGDYTETSVGDFTVKIGNQEEGGVASDGIVQDADGNVVGQYAIFSDTNVDGSIEMASSLDESAQGKGISTKVYQEVANKTGKPVLPASVNGNEDSSFSAKAAAFWKSMLTKGVAEEVEVTDKDGKTVRTLAVLPEGFVSTDTIKRIEDSGVEESNVESEKFEQEDSVQSNMDEGTFTLSRKGTDVTYKIDKINTDADGNVVSVTAIDPNGRKKTIRAKDVIAQIEADKIIHENKLTENEITEQELEGAIADSGATETGRVQSDTTGTNTETVSEEQRIAESGREELLKKSVNYQGVQGRLIQDTDGSYYVVTPDGQAILVEGGQSESTNGELGLTKGKSNLEVAEDEINAKKEERKQARQELADAFVEIDQKLPPDASGAFVDAINEMGGDNPVLLASAMVKALGHRLGKNVQDALGEGFIRNLRKVAKRLEVLNKELSTKELRKKRKEARVKDSAIEAKQIKAERKAKEDAARKRAEANTDKAPTPQEKSAKKETVQEKRTQKKTEQNTETVQESKTEPISDDVWDEYNKTGKVPQHVVEKLADHFQNGTVDKMSQREFAIFNNMTPEIHQTLLARAKDGSYKKKSVKEAADTAISVMERRLSEIATALKAAGFTDEQIAATAAVFNKVARRWARNNNKSEAQFYSEVLLGIEVADLGSKRKAATKKVDGGYIVQISENTEIDSPIHELAHIFENFLTESERKAVLRWSRDSDWTRDTSEKFARGFIKFLESGDADGMQENVFDKFKQWLGDLYHGLISYKGTEIPSLNQEMKEIFSKMLDSEVPVATQENYQSASKNLEGYYKKFAEIGIKFRKSLFESIANRLEINTEEADKIWGILPNSFRKFSYTTRKLRNILHKAVEKGYTNIDTAMDYANNAIASMMSDPDYLPTADAEQLLGYGYALMTMEEGMATLQEKIKKNPQDAGLKQLREELALDIANLSQTLALARSEAGLRLKAGSFNLSKDMYSVPNVVKNTEASLNRKLTQSELRQVKEKAAVHLQKVQELEDRVRSKGEFTQKQREQIANEIIASGIFDNPFFKEMIAATKKDSPRGRSHRLDNKLLRIKQIMRDSPNILYDEEQGASTEQLFKEVRDLVSILVGIDPGINSFTKLHETVETFLPDISQDLLLDIMVWSDPAYQKAQADKVASSAAIIKRESKLLDQIRNYVTETFKEVERTGNKTVYPTRLDTLDKFIEELKFLSASDRAITDESFMEAATHLEALQTMFADLSLDRVDFRTVSLEDLIDKVGRYEKARKLNQRLKEVAELDNIEQQLRDGTYEGDLNDFSVSISDEVIKNRLEEYADKIGLNEDEAYKMADRRFKILKKISDIVKRVDGPQVIEDFTTLYQAVKDALPSDFELTPRDLYSALLHKVDIPTAFSAEYRNMEGVVREELKALDKLERFFKKPPPKRNAPLDANRRVEELMVLVDEIEKLSRRRYQHYSNETLDSLSRRFGDLIDNYRSILSGDITSMTVDDLIHEVSKIKDQEELEKASEKVFNERVKLNALPFNLRGVDNIFEILPEILPKLINEQVESLKQEAYQDAKQQRLMKVNKVLDIIRDKIRNNTSEEFLNSPEYTAIQEFLNIEKRVDDVKSDVIRLNREVYLKRSELKTYINSLANGGKDRLAAKIINTPRLLVLAGDISFVTYQGGVMLVSHPLHAASAFKQMALAAFSQNNWIRGLADLKTDDYFDAAVASGLKLVDETSLELEEELRLSTILDNFRLFREFRRFGERLYSSYMNHLRFSVFKQMMNEQGIDYLMGGDKQYKDLSDRQRDIVRLISEEINMHTGSATDFFGNNDTNESFNNLLNAGTAVFIAPRLYASVYRSTASMIGSVVGRDVLRNRKLRRGGLTTNADLIEYYHNRRVRNLKRAGALAGFHLAMLAMFTPLMSAFNPFDWDDKEDEREKMYQTTFNPFSSNFLKMQKGQRVFSISPFVSYYRAAFRLLAEILENQNIIDPGYFEKSREMEKKQGFRPHIWDFFKYRFTPFFGSTEAIVTNTDWDGSPITTEENWLLRARDLVGSFSKKSLAPIWLQGIIDNFNKGTMDKAFTEFIIDFVGINSYTVTPYQDSDVSRKMKQVGFRIRYEKLPKSLEDQEDDIKAETKQQFGVWLKGELDKGNSPTKEAMTRKSLQIFRQVRRKAVNN